ncbi:YfiT family bacillithiol transferase [Pedobacter sp. MW01-1-1]|uniref:YfiT family bacillithiol transferase n=1 Tax=Pedobacter sp. MW01-1-1 TaxID=3383027 RepID=UPI003FEDABFC
MDVVHAMIDIEKLKYPIGKFEMPAVFDEKQAAAWIDEIETLPSLLRAATKGLSNEQLNQVYRPEGWTLRQVVHHLPDSHVNAYIRFKQAVTEEVPVIRPYYEERWAETDEAKNGDIELSLALLEALHKRLVVFLKGLSIADFQRTYIHPAIGKELSLANMLGTYAWHGKHHVAHITNTIK